MRRAGFPVSTLAELAGFAFVAAGAWFIVPAFGVAVAGVSLLMIGFAIDDGKFTAWRKSG
jgi:hypothetical protein